MGLASPSAQTTEADHDDTSRAAFLRMKHFILEKKPILGEIIEKRGTTTLYDYAQAYIEVNLNPLIQKRQDELLSTFRREVAKRLGDDIAKNAAAQLAKYYYVSTADHHGPVCTPFFLTSNLIASAPYFENADPLLENIIVLSCANISLNNSSFPRGLAFHSNLTGQRDVHQLSFFPASCRLCPVYNFHPYDQDDIARVKEMVGDKTSSHEISIESAEKIVDLLERIYCTDDVFSCENFSDQVTKTNHKLWKEFFVHQPGVRAPNLIYIEQEALVARLIIDHHLDQQSIIHEILFDKKFEAFITQYFEGIIGAFSRQDNWGTYLFWALPKGAKYRTQVWKHGNHLVSPDGSYHLEMTPSALRRALEEKELIPSMLLTYIIIAFYYGLKCLGGFSQVNYLTYMKNAYIKMLTDKGHYKSIEMCARVQTKELCGDVALAFLQNPMGELVPATGLDLVLYQTKETWPCLRGLSKEVTLAEALNPMMPEFYKIIVPEFERDPVFTRITAEDAARFTGLADKMKPCMVL